ncbi:class I SAM-dependent methyltransferase [Spirillospora sp. CA-142024]|uniref:class I SAM-dependent methyltransferase n=1 Tax=Spirillospora sp. CA-142024 TaxID=3240036 RepID=UPI003D935C60
MAPRRGSEAFATEHAYRSQQAVYRDGTGPDARDVLETTVTGLPRGDLLEVGCGEGALAQRLNGDGWRVGATDASARMCELTRARGVPTLLAALPELPFRDASFDCVVGAWVLHYLDDARVASGLGEMCRVLRPGGWLVLATNSDRHMAELWSRLPGARYRLSFSEENAGAALGRFGAQAEITPVVGTVNFTGYDQAHAFVANQVRPRSIADRLETFDGRLRVTRRAAVIRARIGG